MLQSKFLSFVLKKMKDRMIYILLSLSGSHKVYPDEISCHCDPELLPRLGGKRRAEMDEIPETSTMGSRDHSQMVSRLESQKTGIILYVHSYCY